MEKLKEILKSANISEKELANVLKIKSVDVIELKLDGKLEITTKEASVIKKLINDRTGNKYSLEDLFFKDLKIKNRGE